MDIRRFETEDLDAVRDICLTAFKLTSFHTDPAFERTQASSVVWELYAKPAVTGGRRSCFIAVDQNRVLGFAVYGGYSEVSRLTGRKTATIILLAVAHEYQGTERKVGRRLVEHCLGFFRQNGVRFATVGTDADNLGALKIYSSNGFYPALFWSTWRRGPGPSIPGAWRTRTISEFPPEAGSLRSRPLVSFLDDPSFTAAEKAKIEALYSGTRVPEGAALLEVVSGDRTAGYCLVVKEMAVSELTARPIYRILETAASGPDDRRTVIEAGLSYCASRDSQPTVEVFVRSEDSATAGTLTDAGFRCVHHAVTLHAPLGRDGGTPDRDDPIADRRI